MIQDHFSCVVNTCLFVFVCLFCLLGFLFCFGGFVGVLKTPFLVPASASLLV